MSRGQDEHLFYVLIILGAQCNIFNSGALLEGLGPEIAERSLPMMGSSLQLCSAKAIVPPFLTLPGVFLKPISELIHKAMCAKTSLNLWLKTQFL